MEWLLLLVLLSGDNAVPGEPEPAPVPSGMELLYSNRIAFRPNGEPLITLGLMSGQQRVAVRSASAMQVDFYEAGVLKRASVRAGELVEVTIRRAQKAARQRFVDVEGVAWPQGDALDRALAGWRARGFAEVEAVADGTVLGIGGRVIDNRQYRVVLPAGSTKEASRKIRDLYERFGTRALASARLRERPWGELLVRGVAAPLGLATSFVRFASSATLQVEAVEHDAGYAWHGFEDRSYRGEIYVVVDPDGRLAAVNVLGAEEILYGVVPAELFAASPFEALKAQAVAARTQLLAKLGKRHHDDPFHLCSEQHCQVYPGLGKEDPRSTAAVLATVGEIAFHDGRLVDTVYSSSCGGHTEDNEVVWGNAPDPALRGRPDLEPPEQAAFGVTDGVPASTVDNWLQSTPPAYCARASKVRPEKFRWQRRFTATELASLLAGRYDDIGKLARVEIEERGRGGRVVSLRLVGKKGSATVLHELPIRQLLNNLNSGAFVVTNETDAGGALVSVTFTGGGWGHGVGMCQMGAIGRAEAGHDYRKILAHYYNGATVEKLYGE